MSIASDADTVDLEIPAPAPDRTDYLQDCIDNDQPIPPGTWTFAGPLVVDAGKKMVGSGPTRTNLKYVGPYRDDGAIQIPGYPPGSWAYSLCGFMLSDVRSSRLGCGIRGGATDTGQFGNQSGFSLIDDVWVDGFQYGLRFGDKELNTSSSEVTSANLRVSNCDVAIRLETQNTLDFTFIQLGLANSRIGIETDMAGCVHILGGSASYVSESVWNLSGAGVFSIRNLRTEGCGYLLNQQMAKPRFSIVIDSCETNAGTRQDGVDVFVRAGVSLKMIGGTYFGHVQYEGVAKEPAQGFGLVSLDSVGTRDQTLLSSTGKTQCRYTIRDCSLLNANGEVSSWVNGAGTIGTTTKIPAH